jgi:hypothetical protein
MGIAFANALLPGCAMAVTRHDVTPELALEVVGELLLAVMYSTADALGLAADDDRPKVLFSGDLLATLSPEARSGVLSRIASMAAEFRVENQLASQSE